MSPENQNYNVDDEILLFFSKTSVRREQCDQLAKELVGGDQVVAVAVQGFCSYTVYAGPALAYVVQFRLKSLELKTETVALARQVFGDLAPDVSLKQQLGEDSTAAGQEPLLVYVMTRIPGVSRLDFTLAHNLPRNSPETKANRHNLVQGVARFFAAAWKKPQEVDQAYRDRLAETYKTELQTLLRDLPARFQPIIQATLESLPGVFSLPMVLTHNDFGESNLIVDEHTCHLVGVVDWAEAEIAPFGTNLESLQNITSMLHLKNGWIRYEDYNDLIRLFWDTFSREVGGLSKETIESIKVARTIGLLRARGFTSRLANVAEPVPIKDDESGRYNMMILDGLLLNPTTRFDN